MIERRRNIVPFPKRARTNERSRRVGDSFGKVFVLAMVFVGALAVAAAEVFDVRLTVDRWLSTPSPPTAAIEGRASVTDGDTLIVGATRIRLHGIDAPEREQTCRDVASRDYRCGHAAAMALSDRIGQQTVSCEEREVDRYGRIVAVCFAGSLELNRWLVQRGLAVAYRRYSRDYVAAEAEAKAARRGLWAGSFVQPEEWRRKEQ